MSGGLIRIHGKAGKGSGEGRVGGGTIIAGKPV